MTFYARGLVGLGENVYYRGIIEGGLNKSTIEKKNGILFHGDTMLLADGWKLHRVTGVDRTTLKKVFNYYEDKNFKYIVDYEHAGYDIIIEKK